MAAPLIFWDPPHDSQKSEPRAKKRRKSTQTVLDSLFNVARPGLQPQIQRLSAARFPLRPSDAAATHGSVKSEKMLRRPANIVKVARTVIDLSSSSSSSCSSPPRASYRTADENSPPSKRLSTSSSSSSLPSVREALFSSPKASTSKAPYSSSTARRQVLSSPIPRRDPLSPTKPRQRQMKLFSAEPDETKEDRKAIAAKQREEATAAREAEKRRISLAPLFELPLGKHPVYTRDPDEAVRVLQQMSLSSGIAWDLEWETAWRPPQPKVGVMQFADERGNVLVYQLAKPKRIPPQIAAILASKQILKLGVNVAGDGRKMRTDFGVPVEGLVDLNDIAKAADPSFTDSRMVSLQRLAYRYCGKQLEKGDVRKSRWDAVPLRDKQIKYAALDVWATISIYRRLRGYAEMSGVALDLQSLVQRSSIEAKKSSATGATGPSELKGRHLKCIEAVYHSQLVCVGDELLPFTASAEKLQISRYTTMNYLAQIAYLKPDAIDVGELAAALHSELTDSSSVWWRGQVEGLKEKS